VSDRHALREAIAEWLDATGSPSPLSNLSDLGALHYEVLEMLSEAIMQLHEAGYSKADIHLALSEDVVLARHTTRRRVGN
jgi:hypothetical protein